jgi:hypothetical protein
MGHLDTQSDEYIAEKDVWPFVDSDMQDFNLLRSKLETDLRKWLACDDLAKRFRHIKALRCIQKTARFDIFLDDLSHASIFYVTQILKTKLTPSGLTNLTPTETLPVGNQPEPEFSILLKDVRDAVSSAIRKPCGLYQNPGMTCEGGTVVISRIVAELMENPLANNVRRHIEKARKIQMIKL